MENLTETKKVQGWWNTNPFTYNGEYGVGQQMTEVSQLDIDFFNSMERRYLKHSGGGTQDDGKPVFSRYIDYSALKGKKVLDIAVGTGFSTVTFAQHGADVTGIDLTEYAVLQTKRNLELRALPGEVLQMDAQKMTFPDNTFDFVCAHGCLMHMPDTEGAVAEIYRVLKPGGQVYVWVYHRGWYFWFGIIFLRGILLGKLITNKFSILALTSRYSDGLHKGGNPHTKFYSVKALKKVFIHKDFAEIRTFVNYNRNEWTAWPMKSLSLGKYIPKKLQRFFSSQVGFGLSCSLLARKPHK